MTDTVQYLYILMRSDLESMNPGKMVAQGSHAANACVAWIKQCDNVQLQEKLALWEESTDQGFGTAIVLDGGSMIEIEKFIDGLNWELEEREVLQDDCCADIVHDPSYPLIDGGVRHHLPLDTCAYVFCDSNFVINGKKPLAKFNLLA